MIAATIAARIAALGAAYPEAKIISGFPNQEGVAVCLCSFTATDFVTHKWACLLLPPHSIFQKTLREEYS